jgi:hypothetical protein
MQVPPTDTSEYAALLEGIGSTVRLPAPVLEDDHPALHSWASRAAAMTQSFLAMAVAAKRPPG